MLELAAVLYDKQGSAPEKDVKTLFTKLQKGNFIEERRRTYVNEWDVVDKELRGNKDILVRVDDYGSGYKTIAIAFQKSYKNARILTFDIDKDMCPDFVCDFLSPITYFGVSRPDLAVTRYEEMS